MSKSRFVCNAISMASLVDINVKVTAIRCLHSISSYLLVDHFCHMFLYTYMTSKSSCTCKSRWLSTCISMASPNAQKGIFRIPIVKRNTRDIQDEILISICRSKHIIASLRTESFCMYRLYPSNGPRSDGKPMQRAMQIKCTSLSRGWAYVSSCTQYISILLQFGSNYK